MTVLQMTSELKESFVGRRKLDEAHYRAAIGISQSELKWLDPTPAHYKARKENPPAQTKEMAFGCAVHTYILDGPEQFNLQYAIGPFVSRATKEWKNFVEANPNKIHLQQDEMETIEGMADSLSSNPISKYLLQGEREQSFFWIDKESGLLCKARCDVLHADGLIVDLKTTKDASVSGFASQTARLKYHVQAAYYLDGIAAATGGAVVPTDFVFVAIEREAPFAHAIYNLDQYDIERGRESYKRSLMTLAKCMVTNNYPSYEGAIQPLTLPAWFSEE